MEPASFTFSNDYMFSRVMSDESICRRVIERVLGLRVSGIVYQNTQQEVRSGVFARGIRMDVYVEGNGAVYDVEMQAHSEPCIAKRFRYYQSMIDSGTLARGDDYDLLPESYVIFLCKEDPFRHGLPVYGVERRCVQDDELDVQCGSHWMVLNASAWERAEPGPVRDLLQYVENGSVCEEDPLIQDIDEAVQAANNDTRWTDNYFSISTIEENAKRRARIRIREAEREAKRAGMAEGRAEGIAEGKAEGRAEGMAEGIAEGKAEGRAEGMAESEARYNQLILKLSSEGRLDELARAAEDPALMNALFSELEN